MKIKYLGTAAGEGVPALYCDCDNCKEAVKLGGKEIRGCSQTLIDDALMIDYPADTFWFAIKYKIDLKNIHHYLITHTHSDHLCTHQHSTMRNYFIKVKEPFIPYKFYSGEEVIDMLSADRDASKGIIETTVLEAFKTYDIGEYKVTPLKANHGGKSPLIYIINKGDKTLFYANDSGIFPTETMEYLKTNKPYFNLISWDCTGGNNDSLSYTSHLCMGYIRDLRKQFEELGICDDNTLHCVNHFSHNGKNILYKDKDIYEKQGFIMSYDGLEVEF